MIAMARQLDAPHIQQLCNTPALAHLHESCRSCVNLHGGECRGLSVRVLARQVLGCYDELAEPAPTPQKELTRGTQTRSRDRVLVVG